MAKTRRVVFVEGKDFQVISKFARKLNASSVANRAEFAVVPIEGFSPGRMRNLKKGMETTLGGKISAALVLDRDYRSTLECESIVAECESVCDLVRIHNRKEIENFLLEPSAIDRAAERRLADRSKRIGGDVIYNESAHEILQDFTDQKKTYVTSQSLAARRRFSKLTSPSMDDATLSEMALSEFDERWTGFGSRLGMIPGKEALSAINQELQTRYGISVTPTAIIDAMRLEEIPFEMKGLVTALSEFARVRPGVKVISKEKIP